MLRPRQVPADGNHVETVPPWRLTRPVAVAGLLVAAAYAWLAIGLTRPVPAVVSWLPLLGSVPAAVIGTWHAGGQGRAFWRYMSAGMVLMGLGAAGNARDYFTGDEPGQQIGALTAAIYVAGLLAMLLGLLRIPGAERARIEWIRFGLDIAAVIVTVLTFCAYLVYPRWHEWVGDSASGASAFLVVMGAGCVCVFAFVKVAFTGTGPIDRRSLHLLALTGGAGAIGGALAPLLESRPYLSSGAVVLPTTCLLVCLAADRQARATRAGHPAPRPASRRLSVMPYAAVLATGGLLLSGAITHARDLVAVAIGSVTVTVLVAVRQLVALRDNVRLLDDLDARGRELAHQATHDVLTGLPNRNVLTREINAALDAGEPVTVALIDLDDFKAINDDLGHAVGDALIIAVGERIAAQLPGDGMVARLGGDEYALLLCGHDTAPLTAVAAELRLPVRAGGHDLVVESSIGLAPAVPGDTADELLRRADVAMYEAKGQGKGRVVRYEPSMDQRSAEQSRLAADLRTAMDAGELHLLYQPIVTLPSGSLYGVEALVRWGKTSPVEFIPAAERTGLIVPLGAWILEEACRQAAAWRIQLGDRAPRTVSVNVSARQLREAGFASEVGQVLRRTGLPPEALTVEVTETAVFDGGTALAELKAIAALGVNIALDDFGTGHSSLGLLRTCPADVLKVDKSFVDDVTDNGHAAVVVAALIGICRGMGLRAVAEGVETAAQAEELYRLGYRYAQGYHFARPLPAAEVATYEAVRAPV
ncbi:putative bifunctional diguanylate cyclase/phosphodiesterase [Actinoplanes sp. CA-142083]|uniref:putative bifunctional diguanylate cyclase/phosphodiesterase n=1 Tax=Actinoplanes sp. CA-142083 TaxID=3239903 RepID=UPI003D9404E4